jgi:hypothetical protein
VPRCMTPKSSSRTSPPANLDPGAARTVWDFIVELEKEKKTILNTHNLDEVRYRPEARNRKIAQVQEMYRYTPACMRSGRCGTMGRIGVFITEMFHLSPTLFVLRHLPRAALAPTVLWVQVLNHVFFAAQETWTLLWIHQISDTLVRRKSQTNAWGWRPRHCGDP